MRTRRTRGPARRGAFCQAGANSKPAIIRACSKARSHRRQKPADHFGRRFAIDPLVLSVITRDAADHSNASQLASETATMYVPTANETMRPSRTDSVIFCTSSENTCRPTVLEPLLSLHVREAYEDRTMRREYRGRQRNNNIKTFPYEPLVMGGRLVMPAELQRVHRAVLGGAQITDDMRAVVEKRWPELIAKLPPRSG